jgi:hypothetical protein
MKRRTTRGKTIYLAGLNKQLNMLIVSTVRYRIAEYVGISTKTLARHLYKASMYDTDDYTIWNNISIIYGKTGYAIRTKY